MTKRRQWRSEALSVSVQAQLKARMAVQGFNVDWDESDVLDSESQHHAECLMAIRVSLLHAVPAPSAGALDRKGHFVSVALSGNDAARAYLYVRVLLLLTRLV